MRHRTLLPRLLATIVCGSLAVTGASTAAVAHDGEHPDEPPASNFQKVPLVSEVTQPMQLTVADDGRVFFIERTGGVRIWKPDTGATVTAGAVNVDTRGESGLQGIALDPDFAENGWVYLYYSSIESQSKVLSRFHVTGDVLELDSEVVLLTAPTTFPPRPSHVGGSIEFGPDGNLYLSTGDDTQPYESDGFTPIDEREGRAEFDAQRTSGNTNDLRGKILRITPIDTVEGGYTIPAGNLFAPGTEGTRPEVYAMGLRNPFRMSVDQETGLILLADYGPDARSADPLRGPEGYVEWQVIREPGNYGWPYCHGPNLPYVDYDFATGTSGEPFTCDALVNDSPNNTGLTELPPVIAPDIAYSRTTLDPSFPEVGTGGAPMAGPRYHYDPALDSDVKFPEHYDDMAFFYEWGAHFLAAMELDPQTLAPVHVDRFAENLTFNAPMDMVFGPDGAMYLAEWGRGFGRNNPDDGIYRIEYAVPGERSPVARAGVTPTSGAAPLTVSFSSEGTTDPDEGQTLTYLWDFADGSTSTEANPTHTYSEAGDYSASLTVTDSTGRTGAVSVDVVVGNTMPTVELVWPVDGGLVGKGETVNYRVRVTDPEDGEIDCDRVVVQPAIGHDAHAHPLEELIGCEGSFTTAAEGHGDDANMFYAVTATYTDLGAPGISALTGTTEIILQPKHRQAEHYGSQQGTRELRSDAFAEGAYRIGGFSTGAWFAFEPMNLEGIDAISYRLSAADAGSIEVRADAPDGPLVATTEVTSTGGNDVYVDSVPSPVTDPGGTRTLYFVFTTATAGAFTVDAIDFHGTGVAAEQNAPTVSHTLSPADPTGDSGWYTGPVTLTISAADDSGITAVEVSTDGGATWRSIRDQASGAVSPVELTEDGTHDVVYRATDHNGNTSQGSVSTSIDTVAPALSVSGPADGDEIDGSETVRVDIEATDATSGIASVTATLDGARVDVRRIDLGSLDLGAHTLVVTAVDEAGNTSTTTRTFTVTTSFSDVGPGNQFASDIHWVTISGIADGYADGTYRPVAPVSRQAMAAFLYRLSHGGQDAPECVASPFSDIPADHTFCGAVEWMVDAGLSTGYDDGTYRPTAPVSRQATAAFLHRLVTGEKDAPAQCTGARYTDVPADNVFCSEISWLTVQGIADGYEDETFRPTAPVSRQAMAAFLHRTSELTAQCVVAPRIGFQLYSYAGWIGQLTTEHGSAHAALDHVLGELADVGYTEVQPWAGLYAMVTAEEFNGLLAEHGLKASSGQYRYTDEASFRTFLDYAKEVGHDYTGSGGFGQPGTSTYADTLATADQLNRFGRLSVENGTGKIFGHNHTSEFTTTFPDPVTGESKSAWQILVENTDPRYVTFEVDVFWAEAAGVDVPALLEEYGNRIELLHIKDGDYEGALPNAEGFARQTDVGDGDVEWDAILRAARGNVEHYVIERDGAPSSIEFAEDSFDFLSCSR